MKAKLYALFGNSRTLAFAFLVELLAALDEAKVIDWSQLVGAERAGRVAAILGLAVIGLRLVTRTPVRFQASKCEH